MTPSVTALVLTWNHWAETKECLESLAPQSHPPCETVVIDNASTDETVANLRAQFPRAQLLCNSRNLGFAEGNNVGLRHALRSDADYFFVLNNDTILDPDCLAHLAEDLERHPECAAVAPRILYADSPQTVYFAGGVIHGGWHIQHRGYNEPDGVQYDDAGETDWLTGCALLIRRAALERAGLFEPKFFLVYEDADWSLRARRAGYTLRYASDARLSHKVSRSFGGVSTPRYAYYWTRNTLLWIERNFTLRQKRWMLPEAIRTSGHSTLITEGNPTAARREELLRAANLGVRDYFLRRFGARPVDSSAR